jgi:putative endonuclease
MGEKHFFVYMLASKRNGTLYIGVTGDLATRIAIHREDLVAGFTRRYGVHRLVWYEWLEYPEPAIRREKQLKKWNRAWKIRLIEELNPSWDDLYPRLFE